MGLSQGEIEDCQQCFILFDKDNSGKISCQELGTLVRSLGCNPSEQEMNDIVRSDIKSNTFTVKDLVSVMQKMSTDPRRANEEEMIREAFKVFDRDGNGHVNAAELRHVMTNLGEPLSDGEIDEMLGTIDVDREGLINYEEVVQLMCRKA